jgi:hypothetical protein
VEIWNNLPGVKPVTRFPTRKAATERIWNALQGLGARAAAAPASEPRVGTIPADTTLAEVPAVEPGPELGEAAEPVATVGAQAPDVAPAAAPARTKATRAKKAPTRKQSPRSHPKKTKL